MSRKPLPQQEYIIQKQEHGPSKAAKTLGEQMVTIFFKGSVDNRNYVTYIVESFRNLKQWEDILLRPHEKLRIQFDPGWISYGNTIDADSRPFIIEDLKPDTSVFTTKDEEAERNEMIKLLQNYILTIEGYCDNPAVLEQAHARLRELQLQKLNRVYVLDNYQYINDEQTLLDATHIDPELTKLLSICERYKILSVVDTIGLDPNGDEITVVILTVEFMLQPEDAMLYTLGQ